MLEVDLRVRMVGGTLRGLSTMRGGFVSGRELGWVVGFLERDVENGG